MSARLPRRLPLSSREESVLAMMMLGHKAMAIARELGIGEAAVRSAARRVYDKLGAGNRVEAVMMAAAQGRHSNFAVMYYGA